jgi:hypothetical protein
MMLVRRLWTGIQAVYPTETPMRRLMLVGLILLAGCRGIVGPFERPQVKVDDPRLSIPEQEMLGRHYLSLPDESRLVPPSGAARPITEVGR